MNRHQQELTRSDVFRILRERGVGLAVVEFSGGGDEGGVQGIELFSSSGNKMPDLDEDYGETAFNRNTNAYEQIRQPSADCVLADAMGQPIYDRYGSFAGEFSVSGTIEYDVEKETIKLKKSESVTTYVDSEEDL